MLLESHRIEGVESLREAAWASDLSTVQLGSGCMGGSILHAVSAAGSISLGRFDRSVRARGALAPAGHVAFGLLLEVEGSSIHWGAEGSPGDVGIVPGHGEHEAVHHGCVSYLVLTLDHERLAAESEQRPGLMDLLAAPRMSKGSPPASFAARARGRAAALALTQNPSLWSHEASRECLLDEVAQCVLDVVCSSKPRSRPESPDFPQSGSSIKRRNSCKRRDIRFGSMELRMRFKSVGGLSTEPFSSMSDSPRLATS